VTCKEKRRTQRLYNAPGQKQKNKKLLGRENGTLNAHVRLASERGREKTPTTNYTGCKGIKTETA